MDPKPQPNRERYYEVLRRMTPEQRLAKAIELTEASRELLRAGLKARHPQLGPDEIQALLVEHLLACHKRNSSSA